MTPKYCCETLDTAARLDMLVIGWGKVTWFVAGLDEKGHQKMASSYFCPFCERPLDPTWSTFA